MTGTEVDDEESIYEVEVTLDDGRQVDVQLDADFRSSAPRREDESDAALEDDAACCAADCSRRWGRRSAG